MNCPDCYRELKADAKGCKCGWRKDGEEKAQIYHNCDYCKESWRWLRNSEYMPRQLNRLVGRSKKGGWICRDCYETRAEPDWRDSALKAREAA